MHNEHRASLVAHTVKNLPAMQETWVQSLGQKDRLEKGMATHSSGDCSHGIKRHLLLGWKAMTNLDSILKSRDTTLPTKVHIVKAMVFHSHVRMWELDCREDWLPKNWCFQIMVLEKTLESPLDCKEVKPVDPKENQPWIFIGRTDCWSWSCNTLATMWCKVRWKLLSCVWLFETPWTMQSMEFSKPEY